LGWGLLPVRPIAWQDAQLASAIARPSSIIASAAGEAAPLKPVSSMQATSAEAQSMIAMRCRVPMVRADPCVLSNACRLPVLAAFA
jgi:hypothetical protein